MTKAELLGKQVSDPDERILMARLLDRLAQAEERGAPAHSVFLTPGQQQTAARLLAAAKPRAAWFFHGGYEGAERAVCVFLPDWQTREDWEGQAEGPLAALRCTFPEDAGLTHRDFLGALLGLGLTREGLGDLLVARGVCHIVALRSLLPILLTQWESVGRYPAAPREAPLSLLAPTQASTKVIRDTVSTLRLDAVVAGGFSLSRGRAAELVSSGRVLLNHRECDKPDRLVAEGDVFSSRGLGKCVLKEVGGRSKKGRIMIVLERYI